MLSNMRLDDVLDILGRIGSMSLRKQTNSVSATPGRAAHRGWVCEVYMAGYNNSGHTQASVDAKGASAREAAENCLAAVEKYIDGPTGRADRERYESSYAGALKRHESGDREPGRYERWRHPGPMIPPAKIEWGD